MTAGAWTFTDEGRTKIIDGTLALGDSYKLALFTSGSNLGAGSTVFSGVTDEVGITNTGYAAGGIAVALTASGTSTVTVVMTTAPIWTAGSANLTAKLAAIYELGGHILCYCLLDSGGANVTATSGNTLTVGSDGGTVYTAA